MTDRNTVVFADYDTVVGGSDGPNIDGFFDKDYLSTAEPVETGYVGGSLLNLGDAGIAPVVFKGVRDDNSDKLILAFLCRFSQPVAMGSGAEDDEIFIAIKPTFAGNDDKIRLMLINPVGSSGAVGGTPVVSDPPGSNILTDSPPRLAPIFYKPDGADGWTSANPTGIEVKVRSWNSDPALGAPEIAWSVEVAIPRTAAAGGGVANWIDIQQEFGIYFAVTKIVGVGGGAASQFRFPLDAPNFPGYSELLTVAEIPFGQGFIPDVSTPPLANTAQGVYFMGGPLGIGCRPSGSGAAFGSQINENNNQIGALLGNNGVTPADQVQVEFLMAHWGLPSGNPNFWTRPDGLLPVKVPAGGQTVAGGATDVPFVSNDWDLDNVTPNYKGSGLTQRGFFDAHPHQCMWAQASALTSGVNFRQSSVRRNMDFVGLSDVERDAEVSGEGYEEPENGSGEHDFILQTFCRKMIVQEAIDNIDLVEDGTKELLGAALQGYGDGKDNPSESIRDTAMSHVAAGRGRSREYRDVVVYLWITMGYRVTSEYVIVSGKQYPLLDNGSGSFGFIATHKGVKDNLSWTFKGPKLGTFGPGSYGLKVPHKRSATIRTRLSAEPRGPVGDSGQDLPKLNPKDWIPPVKDRPDPKPGGGDGNGGGGGTPPKKDGCLSLVLALIGLPMLWAATQFIA